MWKKRISFILVIVFSLSLLTFAAGCSDNEVKAPDKNTTDQVVKVNEEAILTQAAIDYFTYLPDGIMVQSESVKDKLDSYYIIDVRRSEDFTKSHIAGAVNIAVKELGKKISDLPKNKPLLLVCYSGQNANQATGVLRIAGFDAHALIGGFNNGWTKAGLPTVQ